MAVTSPLHIRHCHCDGKMVIWSARAMVLVENKIRECLTFTLASALITTATHRFSYLCVCVCLQPSHGTCCACTYMHIHTSTHTTHLQTHLHTHHTSIRAYSHAYAIYSCSHAHIPYTHADGSKRRCLATEMIEGAILENFNKGCGCEHRGKDRNDILLLAFRSWV